MHSENMNSENETVAAGRPTRVYTLLNIYIRYVCTCVCLCMRTKRKDRRSSLEARHLTYVRANRDKVYARGAPLKTRLAERDFGSDAFPSSVPIRS